MSWNTLYANAVGANCKLFGRFCVEQMFASLGFQSAAGDNYCFSVAQISCLRLILAISCNRSGTRESGSASECRIAGMNSLQTYVPNCFKEIDLSSWPRFFPLRKSANFSVILPMTRRCWTCLVPQEIAKGRKDQASMRGHSCRL
jgi:hypothetical protein